MAQLKGLTWGTTYFSLSSPVLSPPKGASHSLSPNEKSDDKQEARDTVGKGQPGRAQSKQRKVGEWVWERYAE